jgi:excisionase family DNA binding protein
MKRDLVDIDGDPIAHEFEVLLLPKDAARVLAVNVRTLSNWAKQGKLRSVATPGGHRRYPADAVRAAQEGRWTDACERRPKDMMSEADVYIVAG